MLQAIFPGTFDPPTNGHLNLIQRASAILDRIVIVISVNRQKACLFSPEERLHFLKTMTEEYPNVEVVLWDKLVVDYAASRNIKLLLRGVRAFTDFGYEFELSLINRGLNPGIETFFIPTDSKYFVLRSSAIKELVALGSNVSQMVPPIVEKALQERLGPKS